MILKNKHVKPKKQKTKCGKKNKKIKKINKQTKKKRRSTWHEESFSTPYKVFLIVKEFFSEKKDVDAP